MNAILLLTSAFPALGQDGAVQRELIRRQQQSEAFTLQLHQSQQLLKLPPGDLHRQIESQQLIERQQLDNMSERQLRDVRPELPQEQRPYERYRMEEERRRQQILLAE